VRLADVRLPQERRKSADIPHRQRSAGHTPATAPDPWTALGLDRSTFFDPGAKEALLRGNAGIEGTHGTRR
jgi:3-mercaptopyruvate sulfurtransferase SseA